MNKVAIDSGQSSSAKQACFCREASVDATCMQCLYLQHASKTLKVNTQLVKNVIHVGGRAGSMPDDS